MTRITLAAVVSCTAFAMALTACGSSGKTPPATQVDSISVLDYYTTDNDNKVIQATLESCGKEVGVSIDRQKVPGNTLIQKVLQLSSSKQLPDILMLDNPDVQQIAATGALTPVTDLGLSGDGYTPGMIASATYNGKLYGLGPEANTIAIFYNTDIFEKANIQPPKTWDEMRRVAKQLTKRDQYGLALSAVANYEGTWQFMPFFWSAGADEKDITSPEAAKALQYWVDLMNDGSISKGALNWTQGDVMEQFANGKAAMMVNGPWQIPDMKKKYPDLKWKVVKIPAVQEGAESIAPLGGEVWTLPVSKNPARQAKAADVLKCFTSDENQMKMGVARQTVPTKESIRANYTERVPEMKAFADQVSTARSRTGEIGDKWPKTAEALYTAMQTALTGKSTPLEALQTASKTLN